MLGRAPNRFRRRRVQTSDQLADWNAGDEIRAAMLLEVSAGGARHNRVDESAFVLDGIDRAAEKDGRTLFAGDVRHAFPHLSRPESRISELIDQRRDDLAAVSGRPARDQRAAKHEPEVEALDSLGGPVGGQLLGADAPNLFCVRLEEDAEETPSELVANPVLEALRILHRLQPRPGIAGNAAHSLERSQVPAVSYTH